MKTGRHPKWATKGPHGVEIPRFLTTKLTSETLCLWTRNTGIFSRAEHQTHHFFIVNAKTMYSKLQIIYCNTFIPTVIGIKKMLFFATHIGSSRPGFGSAWKSALDRHDRSVYGYPKIPNVLDHHFQLFDGNFGIYLRHFWTHPYLLFGSILIFWWLNHRLLLFTEDITENRTSGQPLSLIFFDLHPPRNSHTSPFLLVKHLSH